MEKYLSILLHNTLFGRYSKLYALWKQANKFGSIKLINKIRKQGAKIEILEIMRFI